MVRVAINGFGRIGRMVFRAGMHREGVEFVAVNDLTDPATLAHLLKYDSVHGKLSEDVHAEHDTLVVGGRRIKVFAERDPANLPWGDLGIDVVVESTGFFTSSEKASAHIEAGARRVVISAPAKDDTKTVILGINEHELTADDAIVSMASCTSNCLAPLIKVLNDNFGVERGFFNTIHSYTGDQNLVDGPHKDLRRARASAINMVPTTSGAAVAVEKALPAIAGKVTGIAIRVPTPDGSITDFTCTVSRHVTRDEINALFRDVAEHHLKGIVRYSEEPLVSTDIVGDPHSCILDALSTDVLDGTQVRVLGWYDNEWGYSNRVVDLLQLL